MTRLLALITLLTSACAHGGHVLHVGDDVTLRVQAVSVSDSGYTVRLAFDVGTEWRETIQRLEGLGLDAPGWEAHRQSMWISDFQTLKLQSSGVRSQGSATATAANSYHDFRRNTVWPGKTFDAPWCSLPGVFKGVVLLDGWLNEHGEPVSNALYFKWGGKQGGTWEVYGAGLMYLLEYWTSDEPDNPRPGSPCIRITVPDGIFYWTGD